MENIEQILLKMLPGKEERDKYIVFLLQHKWQEICGENVARHSKPVHLENKTLYINTDSSVWSNHLLLMKKQFLKNINGALTKKSIGDLKFFNGSVENFFLQKQHSEEEVPAAVLDDEEKRSILQQTAAVKNAKLREGLVKLKAKAAVREKSLLESGKKRCLKCGAVISGSGDLCNVCRRYGEEELHNALVRFLLSEPWADYESCKKTLKCDKILYDSVKNTLKQHYFAKVADGSAAVNDELLAVMFKTGKSPEQIDESTYNNVLANLRRK